MAWIESHQTLASHPKTRKAARALGIQPAHLIGHLHCLWHWALDLAEDGDLTKFDADDIAIAAQWEGDADLFLEALVNCGFGDGPGFLERDGLCGDPSDGQVGRLVLHDWWSYAGKLVARRQKDRQRKIDSRSTVIPEEVPRTSHGQAEDVQRSAGKSHTRPDRTEPTKSLASAKPPRQKRKPDPIFDALVAACNLNPAEITSPARGAINKAAAHLREINASAEGIVARAVEHRRRWPEAECTPSSLAKNYAQLGSKRAGPVPVPSDRSKVFGTPEWEARQQARQREQEQLVAGGAA